MTNRKTKLARCRKDHRQARIVANRIVYHVVKRWRQKLVKVFYKTEDMQDFLPLGHALMDLKDIFRPATTRLENEILYGAGTLKPKGLIGSR